jgi:hypothetical protein
MAPVDAPGANFFPSEKQAADDNKDNIGTLITNLIPSL